MLLSPCHDAIADAASIVLHISSMKARHHTHNTYTRSHSAMPRYAALLRY